MEPIRAEPPAARGRYRWAKMLDGEWYLVHKTPPFAFDLNAAHHGRIRSAAYQWGKRHGYKVETQTNGQGAELYVRFTKETSA